MNWVPAVGSVAGASERDSEDAACAVFTEHARALVRRRARGDHVVQHRRRQAGERRSLVDEGAGNVRPSFPQPLANLRRRLLDAKEAARRRGPADRAGQQLRLIEAACTPARAVQRHGEDGSDVGSLHDGCQARREQGNDGRHARVLEGVNELAGSAGHLDRGANAVEGVEPEAAGAVAGALPAGPAIPATTSARGSLERPPAWRAEERAEAPAPDATRREEDVQHSRPGRDEGTRERHVVAHGGIARLRGASCKRARSLLRYNQGVVVTIRLFASVADAAGCRRLEIPLLGGETVADVRARLVEQYPQLARFVPALLYAIDEEYVTESAIVPDGATLALIPPVSGG